MRGSSSISAINVAEGKERKLIIIIIIVLQYSPLALQLLQVRKLHATWWISTQNPLKKPPYKIFTQTPYLHPDVLHANLRVFLR